VRAPLFHEEQKKKGCNPAAGAFKTTHTFTGAVYSTAIGRNMSVVSEKAPCRFHTLKRKNKRRKPSSLSKYIFT
jgi:hypothetical protein